MEKEWENVAFDILPYKETGTYIIRTSEDTSQLLDDHIVMTQSMSFSPFKKPFEDRINSWENKLKTTQVWWCSLSCMNATCFHLYFCVYSNFLGFYFLETENLMFI